MGDLTVCCGRPGTRWYTSIFPSLCSITQITTASHCKQSELKTSLISSHSQMSACNDKIPKDTSLFLILFQTITFGDASLCGTKMDKLMKPKSAATLSSLNAICCLACVLYHLGGVVVWSSSLCARQLTLADMPPGGIPSILMRVSAEECYAMSFCVS